MLQGGALAGPHRTCAVRGRWPLHTASIHVYRAPIAHASSAGSYKSRRLLLAVSLGAPAEHRGTACVLMLFSPAVCRSGWSGGQAAFTGWLCLNRKVRCVFSLSSLVRRKGGEFSFNNGFGRSKVEISQLKLSAPAAARCSHQQLFSAANRGEKGRRCAMSPGSSSSLHSRAAGRTYATDYPRILLKANRQI